MYLLVAKSITAAFLQLALAATLKYRWFILSRLRPPTSL